MLGLGIVSVGIATPLTGGVAPIVATPPPIDFPNPQGPRPPIDLRSWMWSTPLNLIGQDTFYGGPGMGAPAFDYPNPRGYVPASVLLTWAWSTTLSLVGADKFYGAGGPVYDYPNPRAPQRSIELLTMVNFGPSLLHFTPTFGLGGIPNFDQPNPQIPRRAVDLLSWLNPLPLNLVISPGAPALVFSVDLAATTVYASDSPSGQGWKGLGYMAKYELNSNVQINGDFLNAINDIYVDPTGVTLFVLDPSGFQSSYQYTPNVLGPVVRDSQGHYHFVQQATKSGTWTYKWQATGSFIGTSPDTTFVVNASALIPG
jgi:hypothetical protein